MLRVHKSSTKYVGHASYMGEMQNAALSRKPEANKPLGRPCLDGRIVLK
jgi:hypothetical protein